MVDLVANIDEAIASGALVGVRADIKSFFDRIPRATLDPMLASLMCSPALRLLVFELLRHPRTGQTGVPQGIGLSTLVANLYLAGIDRSMAARVWYVRFVDDVLILSG